jgi:hypothetical protein
VVERCSQKSTTRQHIKRAGCEIVLVRLSKVMVAGGSTEVPATTENFQRILKVASLTRLLNSAPLLNSHSQFYSVKHFSLGHSSFLTRALASSLFPALFN